MKIYVLIIFLFLTACGGSSEPISSPAPAPVPAPAPEWITIWEENWTTTTYGGWRRDRPLLCAGKTEDPDVGFESEFLVGNSWITIGNTDGIISSNTGFLIIDSHQYAGGFAIQSANRFDYTRPIRLKTTIDLKNDLGAWLGITFINGESDYRELSLYWRDNKLRVGLWAPCYLRDIQEITPGNREIILEWLPKEGWNFYIDGVLVTHEPLENNNAALVGNPAIGVYVVNLEAESRNISEGRVRATVGPIIVSTIK